MGKDYLIQNKTNNAANSKTNNNTKTTTNAIMALV